MSNEKNFSELATCLFDSYVNSRASDDGELDLDELLDLAIKNMSHFIQDKEFYDKFLKFVDFDAELVDKSRELFEILEEILLEMYHSYFSTYIKFINIKYRSNIDEIVTFFERFGFQMKNKIDSVSFGGYVRPSEELPHSNEVVRFAYDCFLLRYFFDVIIRFRYKHKDYEVKDIVSYLVEFNSKDIIWNEDLFIKNYTYIVPNQQQQEHNEENIKPICKILSSLEWQCDLCTFLNDCDQVYCAMCKAHKTNCNLFNV